MSAALDEFDESYDLLSPRDMTRAHGGSTPASAHVASPASSVDYSAQLNQSAGLGALHLQGSGNLSDAGSTVSTPKTSSTPVHSRAPSVSAGMPGVARALPLRHRQSHFRANTDFKGAGIGLEAGTSTE